MDNDKLSEQASEDVLPAETGIKEYTFEPNNDGQFPEDTIPGSTAYSELDDDDVEEVIRELQTYKTIPGGLAAKAELKVNGEVVAEPVTEVAKEGT